MSDKVVRFRGAATTAILRVDKSTTTLPVRFLHLTSVTLYVRGSMAPGDIVGNILRHCRQLQRVRIERRDNDWEAIDAKFVLAHEQEMADALRGHASLQEFSLIGVASSVNHLCEALVTLPKLHSVTLSADLNFASKTTSTMVPLLSPKSLCQLLQYLTQGLCLTGLFPETLEYSRILHDAFVRDANTLHILVLFSGNNKPTAFSYYIREVMELNQMGRRRLQENDDRRNHEKEMMQMLLFVARRHRGGGCHSLDTAYLLIRENPWLCSAGTAGTAAARIKKMTWKQKLHRAVKKIRWFRTV